MKTLPTILDLNGANGAFKVSVPLARSAEKKMGKLLKPLLAKGGNHLFIERQLMFAPTKLEWGLLLGTVFTAGFALGRSALEVVTEEQDEPIPVAQGLYFDESPRNN